MLHGAPNAGSACGPGLQEPAIAEAGAAAAYAVARGGQPREFESVAAFFAQENPGCELKRIHLNGEASWQALAGVEHLWLEAGRAEVQLLKDGTPHSLDLPGAAPAWQELTPGDLLVLDATHAAQLRGQGNFWCVRCAAASASPWAGLRRLAWLEDQPGGCNTGRKAFRRLQITWRAQAVSAGQPEGDNLLGSHVVFIESSGSRTHFHPVSSIGGGKRQHELYLVLDPELHGLPRHTPSAGVWIFPEPGAWERVEFVPLVPGDVLSIRAGVAHRAAGVLACVVALPGFKPGNEVYVDTRIARETNGQAPHNPAFVVP